MVDGAPSTDLTVPPGALPTPASERLTGRILVVDDTDVTVRFLTRLLEHDGHSVYATARSDEALHWVLNRQPDLVLLDVVMPGVDGFDVCRAIKRDAASRLTPVVLITALNSVDDRIRGIDAGADDFLTKPVNGAELRARVQSLLRLKRYTDELDTAEAVILSLALTIEARDASTDGHCQRLAVYAVALGRALGLGGDDLSALERGGFLHDLGKIAVPDSVLLKPGRLTPEEFAIIQQHTVAGERLCGALRSLAGVRSIIRSHHERWDGSGYPDGLSGDRIPLLAQIISVVDVYDALTTTRPYRAALPADAAILELRREAARGWRQPGIVDAFVRIAHEIVMLPVRPR